MTDTSPIAAPAPVRTGRIATDRIRKPSAKTLARSLAVYLKANNIKGDVTVSEVMNRLKSSIVTEEVGVSLDGWET